MRCQAKAGFDNSLNLSIAVWPPKATAFLPPLGLCLVASAVL